MKTLLFSFALIIISVNIMAQDRRDAVAQQALSTYKQLQAAQPTKNENVGDTALWTLGSPVRTAIVQLDKLREYKPGDPAKNLIMQSEKVIYPVINSRTKRVAGSIALERKQDNWVASSFGRETGELQKKDSLGGAQRDYTLVKILAFNLSFLAYEEGGTTQLIPLQDDRERDIVRGRPVAAEKIFERYVKAANEYNGLPL